MASSIPAKHDPTSYQWINPHSLLSHLEVREHVLVVNNHTLLPSSMFYIFLETKPSGAAANPEELGALASAVPQLRKIVTRSLTTLKSNSLVTATSSSIPKHKSTFLTSQRPVRKQFVKPSTRMKVTIPTEFTYFAELPFELRCMILHFACNVSRVIDLQAIDLAENYDRGVHIAAQDKRIFQFMSPAERLPSILHVSQEARFIDISTEGLY
ncbi:hypothetical protein VTL71DRAFT_15836 [Oculimacula yallundae]|uniref:2EXR domain-containing protein n=1 Tax=Oculimacula yallundae TaxID=86028 RepID=A0ABR4CCS7_9HELO